MTEREGNSPRLKQPPDHHGAIHVSIHNFKEVTLFSPFCFVGTIAETMLWRCVGHHSAGVYHLGLRLAHRTLVMSAAQ